MSEDADQSREPSPNGTPVTGLAGELGKRHPFRTLSQEAYISVLRTANRIEKPFDELVGEHDLSQSLFNVLRIVKGHEPDGVTCQRIGEHLISRGPDVTRLVNRLVDRKYVERVQCNLDLRRRLVRLTKAGQQALDQLTPQVDALHLSQFDGLEDDELRQLIVLLTRLREAAARHEAANNADASPTK